MLSEEGFRERKWGRFPALRKALEDKSIPNSYYSPISVSDNTFEALHRLVEIAILAREHESVVRKTAQSVGPKEMYRDLHLLQDELEGISSLIRQHAKDVRALCSKL